MENNLPMQVLSVNTSDNSGGAARAAYRIHQGVRSFGVDSQMFVKQRGSDDLTVHSLDEFAPHGVVHSFLDWCAAKCKNKIQHFRWAKYPNQDKNFKSDLRATRIYGALQKMPYDVLHLHWLNQRFLPLDELKNVRKPIVWTLHDSWPFCGVCHYFLDCERYKTACGSCPQLGSNDANDMAHQVWQRKQYFYQGLDLHIVAPSRWLANCAKQSALFRDCDVRVIPNCLDTDVFRTLDDGEVFAAVEQNAAANSVLRAAGEKAQKPFVLYGAVNAATDRRKGFSSLLSALELLDKQGFSANLIVFGANATDLPLKFSNINVDFIGYVDDTDFLVALYNLADVMVVPSLSENLSCAIMESLSCGTPVCCFNIGGNSDLVEHQKNGYLASPRDVGDLANGIRWCVSSNFDNKLGHFARQKVEENFSIQRVSEQYIALYNEVLSASKQK